MITKWDRDTLEDKYLRMYEENLILKKHARKQEDKIKRFVFHPLPIIFVPRRFVEGDYRNGYRPSVCPSVCFLVSR